MKLFDPENKLPNDCQYVLAHFPDRPWGDRDAPNNEHKWVVVKFVRGLSKKERESLDDSDERKKRISPADEHDNNQKPYFWKPFGPGGFRGQEASCWCELPANAGVQQRAERTSAATICSASSGDYSG